MPATQQRINATYERRRKTIQSSHGRAFARDLSRYFAGQARRLEAGLGKRIQLKEAATQRDFNFSYLNWNAEERELTRVVKRHYASIAETAFKDVSDTLGVSVAFDLNARRVETVMGGVGNLVKGVTADSRNRLRGIIQTEIGKGSSPEQVARSLLRSAKGWAGLEDLTRSRAMVIARTETANAYNLSSVAAFEQSGLIKEVICLDAPTCGWVGHDSPERANGTVRTLAAARAQPTSHPNCIRAFAPKVGTAPAAKPAPKPKAPPKPKVPASEKAYQRAVELDQESNALRDRALQFGYNTPEGRELRAQLDALYKKRLSAINAYGRNVGKELASIDDPATVKRLIEEATRRVNSRFASGQVDAVRAAMDSLRLDALNQRWAAIRAKLPWGERVQFDGPVTVRHAFDRMNAYGPTLEQKVGRVSEWTGRMTGENRPGTAGFWDHHRINLSTDLYHQSRLPQQMWKTEMHELLHTISNQTGGGYAAAAGWEEGVVELATRAMMKQIHPTAKWAGTYDSYTDRLENMLSVVNDGRRARGLSVLDETETWTSLLNKPILDRPKWMKDRLKEVDRDAFFKDDFAFLSGGNKVVKA